MLSSHGLGDGREGGDAWGSTWAEAGLAVPHLQHRRSDFEVLRSGMTARCAAATLPLQPAHQRAVARVTATWGLRCRVDDPIAQRALYGRMGLGPGERWRFD